MSKIKNLIMIGFILSFLNYSCAFAAHKKADFSAEILNTHNQNEIIYLINNSGELTRLNKNMKDIVTEDLPSLLSISVGGTGFAALTEDNKIISSSTFNLFNRIEISKMDKNFFLTANGRVFTYNGRGLRFLNNVSNIKDIRALSNNVVLMYNDDNSITIMGDGSNGISELKFQDKVLDAVVHDDNALLVIKNDGTIVGVGDGYSKFASTVESIFNAKKFIKDDENLYVVTFDNKAIPLDEKYFKAPKEYLSDIENIVIDKFSSDSNNFYKSYFISTGGEIVYHIQSDNEISNFNKNKIAYISTFDNVQNVYESGYLTIVLHRDGSITIPYDIEHELNGITGVKDVILENQSYVVYLNDGQVITSLDNFILNKIDSPYVDGNYEMTVYNYLNKIFINILNRYVGDEEFENLKSSISNNKSNIKKIIKDICLDRKFIMLDDSYNKVLDNLYDSILNNFPNEDERKYINDNIIEKMIKEGKNKYEIVEEILDNVFENENFEKIYNSFI